jgi:hypothetical protein
VDLALQGKSWHDSFSLLAQEIATAEGTLNNNHHEQEPEMTKLIFRALVPAFALSALICEAQKPEPIRADMMGSSATIVGYQGILFGRRFL